MLPTAQLHPAIVHFPIVFVFSLAAFDVLATMRGKEILAKSRTANISASIALLAGISAVAAFVLGDMAYDIAVASGVPTSKLDLHEGLGTWTAGLVAALAVARGWLWWHGDTFGRHMNLTVLAAELVAATLIIATAYFGGELVYEFGINVLRNP